ncbi:MAG: hypothetical protein IJ519_00640, partial [Clostridia bacterium]|nr:hypothetical protein [Clostridia bacterium]
MNFDLPSHACGPNMRTYFDVAKEICEKWNIRYFDMLENTKVNSDLKVTAKTYLPDNLHPNKGGYDILAPMIEDFMKTLEQSPMPGSNITDDGNVYNVTFKDDDGTVLSTTTATRVEGLKKDAPAAPAKGTDGIVSNFFEGWTVDGELVDAPDAYDFTSDVTFVAKYAGKGYGARFEDRAPIVIGDGSTPQELLPETVKLHPESTGITFIYKVEGAESMVVADDWYIYTNNSGAKKPAAQWGDSTYSLNGFSSNRLDLTDGCYYIYVNQNLNGTNAKTPEILNSFSIFNPHTDRYDATSARDPKNTNTGATFQLLAVTCDNLQPTVTFHGADGDVIGRYTYKYTDIHKNLGYGTADRKYSCQKGMLMSASDIFALTGFTAPEAPEGSILLGWSEDPSADEVVLAKGVYYNCDLYPVFKEFTEDDYEGVTFVDGDGDELFKGEVLFGKLVSEDWPASCDKAHDGVYLYKFLGWTVDGESTIDPAKHEFEGGEVVKPLYTVYGVVYDDPAAQPIPTDTSKEVNFMTDKVNVSFNATGITWVYKVDGVTEDIIADNFIIATRNSKSPAWQFDDANYCVTGDGTANMMTLKNGYFFVYVNVNVNGMNSQKADNVINKFAIYAPTDANYAAGGRIPVNNNENATLTMLAVLNNDLQPTATFHLEDGSELISYTHKYTDINRHLGSSKVTAPNNYTVKGSILSVDEVFALTELATPTKEATHNGKVTYAFDKWVDADGNAVDALYYNVDLYPSFKIASDTRETFTVKFVDEDGSELYSTTILEGETPVYVGDEPAKAADKKNTYAFDGWDAEIAPAAGNVTYTATYKATEIIYTVTFMNG